MAYMNKYQSDDYRREELISYTPRGFKAAGDKVHGNEHADIESLDELSATKCISSFCQSSVE